MTYGDPRFQRMERPGAQRHGRQVTRRDKFMAIAFGALLVFGLWWILFRPPDFKVSTVDIAGVVYHTKVVPTESHQEYYGYYGQSDVVVLIGFDGKHSEVEEKSLILLAQMLLADEYPDATRKRFSNAFVVCGVADDCKSIARKMEDNARDREADARRPSAQ